jgi:chemotaxis protein MotB
MAMKKKAAAPEPAGESAPMWIVSFADLVTLMMSFFVVLYALKQGGEKRQMEVAAAIKATFDPSYIPSPDSPSEWDQAIRRAHGLPGPPFANLGGTAPAPTKGASGAHDKVETIRPGKSIVTGSKITFAAGETVLDEESKATIRRVADLMKGLNNILMIKGHISADEVSLRPDDPDGMALSYRRAVLVADELAKLGVDRRVLRPVACGPFEPVKTGVYDTVGLRQNRRVEVFTTEYTAGDYNAVATVPAGTETKPAVPPETKAEPKAPERQPHGGH